MAQYLVKRLLIMLVTLFGICVVSFLLATIAPGDPAALKVAKGGRRQGNTLDELTIKKNREMYNLDLPRFVNPKPLTRRTTAEKALGELKSRREAERKDASAKLGSIGTAGLDVLIAALPAWVAEAKSAAQARTAALDALAAAPEADLPARLSELAKRWPENAPPLLVVDGKVPGPAARVQAWQRQRAGFVAKAEEPARLLLEALSVVVPKEQGGPAVDPAKAPLDEAAAAWAAWWQANAAGYGPDQAAAAARAWLDASDATAPVGTDSPPLAALLRVGTRAAPPLMDAMTSAPRGSPRERRAAYALAQVCKKPWDLWTSDEERAKFEKEWADKKAALDEQRQAHVEALAAWKKLREDPVAWEKAVADAAAKQQPPPDEPRGMSAEAHVREVAELGTQQAYVARAEAEEFGLHRYRWADWWYRAEEQYADFSAGRQAARTFSQTQFGRWIVRFVRFDFGESYKYKRPVKDLLLERLQPTLVLNGSSLALAFLIAVPIGIYSAVRRGTLRDRITTTTLFLLYSLPSFWAASMFIWLLTGKDKLPAFFFKSQEYDTLTDWGQLVDIAKHCVLPILALTYAEVAYTSRQMRTGMLDVIRQDYIRTARAKGLPERTVIWKHAVRNGLIPVLTLLGTTLSAAFTGSVIIETIFSIDGIGKLAFEAIDNRDYPVIMAELVIASFLTLAGYLISDLAYAVVDPRIEFR